MCFYKISWATSTVTKDSYIFWFEADLFDGERNGDLFFKCVDCLLGQGFLENLRRTVKKKSGVVQTWGNSPVGRGYSEDIHGKKVMEIVYGNVTGLHQYNHKLPVLDNVLKLFR